VPALNFPAIDGLVLDVAGTPTNDEEFGRSGNARLPARFLRYASSRWPDAGTHGWVASDKDLSPAAAKHHRVADLSGMRDLVVLASGAYGPDPTLQSSLRRYTDPPIKGLTWAQAYRQPNGS
jgi:hypothetical protein